MSPEERQALILAPEDDPRLQALGMEPGAGDLLRPSPERRQAIRMKRAAEEGARLARLLSTADPLALSVAGALVDAARAAAEEAHG